MSKDAIQVSSLVMTALERFQQTSPDLENRARARFQGGSAGSNPVGGTSEVASRDQ